MVSINSGAHTIIILFETDYWLSVQALHRYSMIYFWILQNMAIGSVTVINQS